jgi:hypothetical protein
MRLAVWAVMRSMSAAVGEGPERKASPPLSPWVATGLLVFRGLAGLVVAVAERMIGALLLHARHPVPEGCSLIVVPYSCHDCL